MKQILNILILAISIACVTSLSAQNLVVTLTNSTTESFPVEDIQSIKFGSETMILNELDGTVNTWNIDDIDNYAFDGVASINEVTTILSDKVSIYPNPSSDKVYINYASNRVGLITVVVYDINGRLIEEIFHGEHKEITEATWSPKENMSVQAGKYLIQIITTSKIITKPVIIQ